MTCARAFFIAASYSKINGNKLTFTYRALDK